MVIVFGVPAENFEKGKEVLKAYKNLIVECRVSKGTSINVYENFTEEIPARFFHVLLKKEANAKEVAMKLSEDLAKKEVVYPNEPCWKVSLFNQDVLL